mmetsp:Transcript_104567/g.301013  ORF Transcript_104567/g.301013 Transcript_104567/m.301013 type:complete len:291 (-) Transcript_104567:331-1203(-)
MAKTPAARCQKRPDHVCVTMHVGIRASPLFHAEASARPPLQKEPVLSRFRERGMIAILTTSFVDERLGSKLGITLGPPSYNSSLCKSRSSQSPRNLSSFTPRPANSSTTRCHSASFAGLSASTPPCANSRSVARRWREAAAGAAAPSRLPLRPARHEMHRRCSFAKAGSFGCARPGCHKRPVSMPMQTLLIDRSSLCKTMPKIFRALKQGSAMWSTSTPPSDQTMTRRIPLLNQVMKVDAPRSTQDTNSTVNTFLAQSTSSLAMPLMWPASSSSCNIRTPRTRAAAATET